MKVLLVALVCLGIGYSIANPQPVTKFFNKVKEEIYERH